MSRSPAAGSEVSRSANDVPDALEVRLNSEVRSGRHPFSHKEVEGVRVAGLNLKRSGHCIKVDGRSLHAHTGQSPCKPPVDEDPHVIVSSKFKTLADLVARADVGIRGEKVVRTSFALHETSAICREKAVSVFAVVDEGRSLIFQSQLVLSGPIHGRVIVKPLVE